MKNKNENSLLTKKDIDKAAWSYIFFAQATQNFERMMGLAFCHVIEPILKKLYKITLRNTSVPCSATCSTITQNRSSAL